MLTLSKFKVFIAMKKPLCLKAHILQEQNDFTGPDIHLPYSLDNMC